MEDISTMDTTNIEKLKTFTMDNIPELDTVVIGALELLGQQELPKIDTTCFSRPLVVGSGNAEQTGRIMFEKTDAIFASESSYMEKLKNILEIDGVVLVSASGEKHAPIIVKNAKEFGKKVMLITNSPNSSASRELDKIAGDMEFIFPKNREPYTYNVSTYMGMILGATGENALDIKKFIENSINNLNFPDFSKYNKYYLLLPSNFSGSIGMLQNKFIELFGRMIARDIETIEFARLHATTVVPSDELFISFGEKDEMWGDSENRFFVPLPDKCDYGAMMAVGYYIVGQIQKAYPSYFKENIANYCEKVSRLSGQNLKPIVEI